MLFNIKAFLIRFCYMPQNALEIPPVPMFFSENDVPFLFFYTYYPRSQSLFGNASREALLPC